MSTHQPVTELFSGLRAGLVVMGRSLQFDGEPQSVSISDIELLSARKQIHKDEGMSDRQTQNGEASMRRGTWRNEKGMHLGFFCCFY